MTDLTEDLMQTWIRLGAHKHFWYITLMCKCGIKLMLKFNVTVRQGEFCVSLKRGRGSLSKVEGLDGPNGVFIWGWETLRTEQGAWDIRMMNLTYVSESNLTDWSPDCWVRGSKLNTTQRIQTHTKLCKQHIKKWFIMVQSGLLWRTGMVDFMSVRMREY